MYAEPTEYYQCSYNEVRLASLMGDTAWFESVFDEGSLAHLTFHEDYAWHPRLSIYHSAVYGGNQTILAALIADNPGILTSEASLLQADLIVFAARYDRPDGMEYLADSFDLDAMPPEQRSWLVSSVATALGGKHLDFLLERALFDTLDGSARQSLLVEAARHSAWPTVAYLLDSGLDATTPFAQPECFNAKGEFPPSEASIIHYAARDGAAVVVEALLDAGADKDAEGTIFCGDDGEALAPLLLAVQSGSLETVTLLVDAGVAIDAIGSAGSTALHLAVRANDQAMVDHLLGLGADLSMTDADGLPPAGLALVLGRSSLFQHLVTLGAPIDWVDGEGRSCLEVAALAGDLAAIELLVEQDHEWPLSMVEPSSNDLFEPVVCKEQVLEALGLAPSNQ